MVVGGEQQILQRQFQLFDRAFDLFRRLAEDLCFGIGDAQPKDLDQIIWARRVSVGFVS